MPVLIDYSGDDGKQMLHKIAVKHDVPDYVKKSPETDLITKTAGSRCAIIAPERRFPCHTKAACWLSHAYFYQQQPLLNSADERNAESFLRKAAAFWGIEDDIAKLREREDRLVKEASQDDSKYPVRNVYEFRAAADYLLGKYADNTWHDLPIKDRQHLAAKLVKASGEIRNLPREILSEQQWETLKKAAGVTGFIDGQRAADLLEQFEDENVKKLASHIRPLCGAQLQPLASKIAQVVDQCGERDEAAELKIATDTTEPTITLGNGRVLNEQQFVDLAMNNDAVRALLRGKTSIDHRVKERMLKEASQTCEATADLISEIAAEQGVKFIAEPPRQAISASFQF